MPKPLRHNTCNVNWKLDFSWSFVIITVAYILPVYSTASIISFNWYSSKERLMSMHRLAAIEKGNPLNAVGRRIRVEYLSYGGHGCI